MKKKEFLINGSGKAAKKVSVGYHKKGISSITRKSEDFFEKLEGNPLEINNAPAATKTNKNVTLVQNMVPANGSQFDNSMGKTHFSSIMDQIASSKKLKREMSSFKDDMSTQDSNQFVSRNLSDLTRLKNKENPIDDLKAVENDQLFDVKLNVDGLEKWTNKIKNKKVLEIIGKKDQAKEIIQSLNIANKNQESDPNVEIEILDAILNDEDLREMEAQILLRQEKSKLKTKTEEEFEPDGSPKKKRERSQENEVEETEIEGKKFEKPKARRAIKSMVTRLNEINQRLINDIISDKVTKKINMSEENIEKPEKNAISTNNFMATNSNLSNFKTIGKIMENANVVNFDLIFKKVNNKRKKFPKTFDLDEEIRRLEKERGQFSEMEVSLLKRFKDITDEICNKKNVQERLRMGIYSTSSKIRNQKEYKEQLAKRFNLMEENSLNKAKAQYQSHLEKVKQGQTPDAAGADRKNRANPQTKVSLEDFIKVSKLREEREQQERNIDKMILQEMDEIKKSRIRIIDIEEEIKELRIKKEQIKLKLKELYLDLLRKDDQKRNEGYFWIIKSLWKINEKNIDGVFPTWLDDESIKFIINIAETELQLEELKDKKSRFTHRPHRVAALGNPLDRNFESRIKEVNKRIWNMKKEKSKVKLPKQAQYIHNRNLQDVNIEALEKEFLREAMGNFQLNHNKSQNDDDSSMDLSQQLEKEREAEIESQISFLRNQLQVFKKKEVERLYTQFINMPNDEKTLELFIRKFKSLFGIREASQQFTQYAKERQLSLKTVTEAQQKYLTPPPVPFESYNYVPVKAIDYNAPVGTRAQTSSGASRRTDTKSTAALLGTYPSVKENDLIGPSHEINYKYNSIYNKFPELRNSSEDSNFYINKGMDGRPISMTSHKRVF